MSATIEDPDGATDLSALAEFLRESLRREGELRERERWQAEAAKMLARAGRLGSTAPRSGPGRRGLYLAQIDALRELLGRMETKP